MSEYVKVGNWQIPRRAICEGCKRKRFCVRYRLVGSDRRTWWCLRCATAAGCAMSELEQARLARDDWHRAALDRCDERERMHDALVKISAYTGISWPANRLRKIAVDALKGAP